MLNEHMHAAVKYIFAEDTVFSYRSFHCHSFHCILLGENQNMKCIRIAIYVAKFVAILYITIVTNS